NTAGHRLSTGAMEEAIAGHPAIAECAVTGIADPLKGQVPLGFLVLKDGVLEDAVDTEPETIVAEVIQRVRETIGPVASFKLATVVARLPKTRSGKILRGTLRKMADGDPWTLPATIDDPVILDEIEVALEALGFPRS
ncbi:MAG: propionyl-CoA synthetase, partial [Acidobacteriota bacterium]